MIVTSPDYLARKGEPLSPDQLAEHDAIVFARTEDGARWRFRQGSSVVSVQVPSRLGCSAAEGVREAVLAGLGLAIVSRWMMQPEIESGAVRALLTSWELPSVSLWAVFPAGRLPTTKARTFVNWFQEQERC